MPKNFMAPIAGSHSTAKTRLTTLSAKVSPSLRITQYIIIFSLAFLIHTGFTTSKKIAFDRPTVLPVHSLTIFSSASVEQNVQVQASLIRENLPAYLDFVGSEVLPEMSKNIDHILYDLKGLTDVKPGLFYHGHIDYSIYVSGEIDGLLEMNNVILQYHTLENPLIFIPYWREELGKINDPDTNAWIKRESEYNRAISTPSSASRTQFSPLTESEAASIASNWDVYLKRNGLTSPGSEMLTNMVYLVDGGKQPFYQEAFKNIYRYHSVAFSSEGYLWLNNKTHLEKTYSPFQITFEKKSECLELLSVFDEAKANQLGYIVNLNNAYVAQHPNLLQNPEMAKLSIKLLNTISALPDDNLIKQSNTPEDLQIAFFSSGDYIFAVYGSLDSPSIFE